MKGKMRSRSSSAALHQMTLAIPSGEPLSAWFALRRAPARGPQEHYTLFDARTGGIAGARARDCLRQRLVVDPAVIGHGGTRHPSEHSRAAHALPVGYSIGSAST